MVTNGFVERLREAMESAGLNQGQLAELLEVSQSAVSQWLAGAKEPSRENLRECAEALRVDPAWLEYGAGPGPQLKLDAERKAYRATVEWSFRAVPPDQGRDYGNANVWSLPWDVNTLVREAIQNSVDAAIDRDAGVEMEFRIIRLQGAELTDFLRAIGWDAPAALSALSRHVQASAKNGQKLGSVLRDGLELLERKQELQLLVVEDRGARGLVGDEFGEGNFAALVRNNLDSSKDGAAAGGSYGLGKAVFMRASHFATVLFNSQLSSPVREGGQDRASRRVIGRSDLSWHEIGQESFAGPGWFGERELLPNGGMRARSLWDNRALTHDLHFERTDPRPGTSILVVGFHDPNADGTTEPQDMAKEIAEAVARNFWPAIESRRLSVDVTTYEGRSRKVSISVDAELYQKPFVDIVRSYRNSETTARLVNDGDIALRPITLSIPRRRAQVDPHEPMDHEAALLVRFDADGEESELSNTVALYRGREMIIEYLPFRQNIPGAPSFRAVVLCGEAVGADAGDRAAERFLRAAEPPAHNEWTSTPAVKSEYVQGGKRAIERFVQSIREEIRQLVKPQRADLDDGPRALKELLRLAVDKPPVSQSPRVRVDRAKSRVDAQGRWDVQARIRLPDERAWRVAPVLVFAAETGGGTGAEWSLSAVRGCSVDGGYLVIPAGTREARFRGISDPASHPAAADDSSVSVVLRQARPVTGGA